MQSSSVRIWVLAALILMSQRAECQFINPVPNINFHFNENNPIGAGAIDGNAFYCYWPAWTVAEPVVTAVELSTGKLLWSIPGRMTPLLAFELNDGWLQFESFEQIHQSSGPVFDFHLVECQTGKDLVFKGDPERYADVIRTVVHQGRCVTPQGLVVKCDDGAIVGDLGLGSHQVLAVDGKLYVLPFENQAMILERESCLLKRYDIQTMQIEQEFVVEYRYPMTLVLAKGDTVVLRCQVEPREAVLVCLNLRQKEEVWRIPIPNGVMTSRVKWMDDSRFAFTQGHLGPIRPMIVDAKTGDVTADLSWQDPRSLLAWHFNGSFFPDLFATDGERIVGRWRTQRLVCIDAVSGDLIWRHSSEKYPTTRLFCQFPKMGKEIVAESDTGFDIISVATPDGSRRAISPKQLGLKKFMKRLTSSDTVGADSLQASKRASATGNQEDLIWELIRGWSAFLWPAVPLFLWLIWSLVRMRYPASKTGKHIV